MKIVMKSALMEESALIMNGDAQTKRGAGECGRYGEGEATGLPVFTRFEICVMPERSICFGL
jgi:hypothetical protein